MEFSEKLRALRQRRNLTQAQVADAVGISLRTYKGYELGQSRPRYRKILQRIATLYGVHVNDLLLEDNDIPESANGEADARDLILKAQSLFAGGHLSDEDKDAVFLALTEAYHLSRHRK